VTATARPPRPRDGPFRERAFHGWLARTLPAGRTGALPLGDDAAALRPPRGRVAVVSTDALVEGSHFTPESPARLVGRAATSVSLSDLASKGAEPRAVLLAMIVPPATPDGWARELVRGAEGAASDFGAHVVGGDTKAGPVRTVVSTAIGWGNPRYLAPRSGARTGDVLVTTGTVGRGGLAFAHLGAGRRSSLRALLDVRPRVREGAALVRWAHAMLDTSDGLAESCRLLSSASRVRVVVDERAVPFAPGLSRDGRNPSRRRSIAFFGGDYELLAALPAGRVAAAVRAVRRAGGDLTAIGSVSTGRGALLRTAEWERPMPAPGWDPFAGPRGDRPANRRPPVGRSRRVAVRLK
jgi:thiamine-monophosphate kinase